MPQLFHGKRHNAFADRVPPIALAMAQASAKEQSFFEG
jgi:hypothetical protein